MSQYAEDRLDRYVDNYARRPIWYTVKLGVLGLIAAVLISFASTGSVFFGAFASKVTAAPRVTQRVYQTDNIIQNVAYFHDSCARVTSQYQAFRANTDRYKADLAASKSPDPIAQAQAQTAISSDVTDVAGARNALYATAQEYNSRSGQYTANPFKDASLPYRIQPPTNQDDLLAWTPPNCG